MGERNKLKMKRRNRKRLVFEIANENTYYLTVLLDGHGESEREVDREKRHVFIIIFELKFSITHSYIRAIIVGEMCDLIRSCFPIFHSEMWFLHFIWKYYDLSASLIVQRCHKQWKTILWKRKFFIFSNICIHADMPQA